MLRESQKDPTKEILKIDRLSFAYDTTKVLSDVSFTLYQGQVGALLGPSGCGKSTLLRCIAGFECPQQGRVIIDGEEACGQGEICTPPERRNVGFIFQDFALFPHLSVKENIFFGLSTKPTTSQIEEINQLIERVGITDLKTRYPHELSGGQQQRVAIARALVAKPKVLLLDEPFSSLDAEARVSMRRELREVFNKTKTTALFVTHDQQDASDVADTIGVLSKDHLEQWASVQELYTCPASSFVANFVGEGTFLNFDFDVSSDDFVRTEIGKVKISKMFKSRQDSEKRIYIRPQQVYINKDSSHQARIKGLYFRGMFTLVEVEMPSGARILSAIDSGESFSIGDMVPISLKNIEYPAY